MPIKIVHYSKPLDAFGKTESSSKGEYIFNMLMAEDEWDDELHFEDDKGNILTIEELSGKEIEIEGIGIITALII